MKITGIHNVESVGEVPYILLTRWQVIRVEGEGDHFIGYDEKLREGRASTEIVKFNKKTMIGVTKSGRIYFLDGMTGRDDDATYVWEGWLTVNGLNDRKTEDVSHEYSRTDSGATG
jgi:hypothetical protein